jgi:hypothetical protein
LEGGFHEGLALLRGPPGTTSIEPYRPRFNTEREEGCPWCGIRYHVGRRPLDRRGSGRLFGASPVRLSEKGRAGAAPKDPSPVVMSAIPKLVGGLLSRPLLRRRLSLHDLHSSALVTPARPLVPCARCGTKQSSTRDGHPEEAPVPDRSRHTCARRSIFTILTYVAALGGFVTGVLN